MRRAARGAKPLPPASAPAFASALALAFALAFALLAEPAEGAGTGTPRAGWSTIPFTELTDADALTPLLRRSSTVEGRPVYYPARTAERADALARAAAEPGSAGRAALRHLAEAKRELGDLVGAEEALSKWAAGCAPREGGCWAEAARWGERYRRVPFALRAAEKALSSSAAAEGSFGVAERKALATDRIAWARGWPGTADADALLAARSALFPSDPAFTEEWVRSLERSGKVAEASRALAGSTALPPARRAVLEADLLARNGKRREAQALLEERLAASRRTPPAPFLRAFASRTDSDAPQKPTAWRAALEKGFDARSLVLLHGFLDGKGQGAAAHDLLVQVELKGERTLRRPERLLLARLYEEDDLVPQAFRCRLASSSGSPDGGTGADPSAAADDLAALASLALKAGTRPLPWGRSGDEPYRWMARVDTTPGIFTGALALLLTGFDGPASLAELEAGRLPGRTFRTGLALVGELEKRAPSHPALPGLWAQAMAQHVQRGEGAAALALLPKTESGDAATRQAGLSAALLALRQAKAPVERESALWKRKLSLLAPDGSTPPFGGEERTGRASRGDGGDFAKDDGAEGGRPAESYETTLAEAVSRLAARDRSHRASLALVVGELDRLPKAEGLWSWSAKQVESWKLDDDFEARWKAAVAEFEGPGWWKRLGRWYARRMRTAEMRSLCDDVVARFRAAELFARDPETDLLLPTGEPAAPWIRVSDYLRLKALERFPSSPLVVREAEARLVSRSTWASWSEKVRAPEKGRGLVADDLLLSRQRALLFVDARRRSDFLAGLVRERRLEAFLADLEKVPSRTPVEAALLRDGWSRLSRFERALPFAAELTASYPGDGPLVAGFLTLSRSLSGLDPSLAAKGTAAALAAAPSQPDPGTLLVAAAESWLELDRPAEARPAIDALLASAPLGGSTISSAATLLWDYGRPGDALEVIRRGRERTRKPHLLAFEAGVLDEELRNGDAALDEYFAALDGDGPQGDGEGDAEALNGPSSDDRARSRLGVLLGRPKVLARVVARAEALAPGKAAHERTFLTLASILDVVPGPPGGWEDWLEFPNDPVGAAARRDRAAATLPASNKGLEALGALLAGRAEAMADGATSPSFLAGLLRDVRLLSDPRWSTPERGVTLEDRIRAAQARLATEPEVRLALSVDRVRFLLAHGRSADAEKVRSSLSRAADTLDSPGARMRRRAELARLAEKTGGDAAAEWKALSDDFPWSLGVLDDRLEFLARSGRTPERLDLLERASSPASAAPGHRERLLERLAADSLAARDVPRARRALAALAALPLDPDRRVRTAGLVARTSFVAEPAFDGVAFCRAESAKLPEEKRADLWAAAAAGARDAGRPKESVPLWIESLNRRLDRGVLESAARCAADAGAEKEMLSFFEAQRARSPRDVRWAVAVRELRLASGNLEGALAAARDACAVAPERESLQREAVTLYERAGRFTEGADFLAPWAAAHAGDEGIAAWRSGLYSRGGDGARALAVERDALAAFRRVASAGRDAAEVSEEAAERTARAARRLLGSGRPELAWKLLVPAASKVPPAEIPLTPAERTEAALRSGSPAALADLLAVSLRDERFLVEAAPAFERYARTEELAALQELLLARIFPAGRAPDEEALSQLRPFALASGLHRFDEALARRLVAGAGHPWGIDPPIEFVRSVVPVDTPRNGRGRLVLSRGPWEREWIAYLAAADRLDLLEPRLLPLVGRLDARVKGTEPGDGALDVARWIPVPALARIAALPGRDGLRASVNGWFSSPEAFRRFEKATGGSWDLAALAQLLSPATRAAIVLPAGQDPVLASRGATERRVGDLLARLVDGGTAPSPDPDAPLLARLRGPRSVGDVVGDSPAFRWAEFAPRGSDRGDDAIGGTGADRGRLPGRLWGSRPGEAWFALEAFARWRASEPDAARVPSSTPWRGGEARRALVAVRLAEASGQPPLALAIDEEGFADLAQADRLARRLRLLRASIPGEEGKRRALEAFAEQVRRGQGKADDATLEAWRRIARAAELPSPETLLDPSQPLSASLLATIALARGPEERARFRTLDEAAYRSAVASRAYLPGAVSERAAAWYLDEIWARRAGPFPSRSSLGKLPGIPPESLPFLEGAVPTRRAEALAAVRALPDPLPLRTYAARSGDRREAAALFLFRAELKAGMSAPALALLEAMARPEPAESPLVPGAGAAPPGTGPDEEAGADAEPEESPTPPRGPSTEAPLLVRALRTLRVAGAADPPTVAKGEELLAARVARDRSTGVADFGTAQLSLELARSPDELAAVLRSLELSWIRGESFTTSDDGKLQLARALSRRDAAAARRWLERIPPATTFEPVRPRAEAWRLAGLPDRARLELVRARRALGLSRSDEEAAFDDWRRLPGAGTGDEAPAAWTAALPFWKKPAASLSSWGGELAAHLALSRSPYDTNAARSVKRSLAPAPAEVVAAAQAALGGLDDVSSWRAARAELARSAAAARHLAPGERLVAAELARRHFPSREIDGLLADAARIGASTPPTGAVPDLLGDRALAQLASRDPRAASALEPELRARRARALPPASSARVEGRTLVPLRPRDLGWDLLSRALDRAEVP